jgi:hypothetical protein
MTPTSFQFSVTMPGDPRLIGAIRQLATHAAEYAQMPAEAREGLATSVERATEAAIRSTGVHDAVIEFEFSGGRDAVKVEISCEAAPAATIPKSTSVKGVSIDWQTEGSRQTCQIRHALTV